MRREYDHDKAEALGYALIKIIGDAEVTIEETLIALGNAAAFAAGTANEVTLALCLSLLADTMHGSALANATMPAGSEMVN